VETVQFSCSAPRHIYLAQAIQRCGHAINRTQRSVQFKIPNDRSASISEEFQVKTRNLEYNENKNAGSLDGI
jgi:hypothetical protein